MKIIERTRNYNIFQRLCRYLAWLVTKKECYYYREQELVIIPENEQENTELTTILTNS